MSELSRLAPPERWPALAAALSGWVPSQRWFAGKARTVARLQVADAVVLRTADAEVLDVFADVTFDDGHAERYHVPLADDPDVDAAGRVARLPQLALADATASTAAAAALAALTCTSASATTVAGATVTGEPLTTPSPRPGPPRRLAAEQSNTSVVYGDALICKLFRKLEVGENPDVEITRALTRRGFKSAPAQHGALVRRENGTVTALAVLTDFVAGGREGWDLATREVARLAASPVDCAQADPWLLERVGDLGTTVADLHATLRDAFGGRDAGPEDLRRQADEMRAQVVRVLDTAAARAPAAAATLLDRREDLLARCDQLVHDESSGLLCRAHGDLHLGQALLDPQDRWQLLDFEGEPARPLSERRALQPPLRDVAGMLRSFDYTAAFASPPDDRSRVPDAAAAWRDEARRLFLDSYLRRAADHRLLPPAAGGLRRQLDAFELDKAVYELGYELANRPNWAPIPVGGILRVLDRGRP